MQQRRWVQWMMVCAVMVLLAAPRVRAADLSPVTREGAFADGGLVIVDVTIGNLRILSTERAGRLRLVIHPHSAEDAAEAFAAVREFSVNGSQAKIVVHFPEHGNANYSVGHHVSDTTLYLPAQSDLKLNVGVGNVEIGGITGNMEADLGVGNLEVKVADPHVYRTVSVSTQVGNVDADALGLHASGFVGKSANRDFRAGKYHLRLHTGVGNVTCERGDG